MVGNCGDRGFADRDIESLLVNILDLYSQDLVYWWRTNDKIPMAEEKHKQAEKFAEAILKGTKTLLSTEQLDEDIRWLEQELFDLPAREQEYEQEQHKKLHEFVEELQEFVKQNPPPPESAPKERDKWHKNFKEVINSLGNKNQYVDESPPLSQDNEESPLRPVLDTHEAGLKPSLWAGGSYWLDPVRGTTPMTWTCQPLSAVNWPALTEYYALTSTANDTFCTGPSGVGYCQPAVMPNLAQFAAFEEPFLQLTGLQWGAFNESMWNTEKANAGSIKCFGHQTTPDTNDGRNHWLDNGTPVAIAPPSLWYPFLFPTNPADPYNISDPNNIVNKITAFVAGTTPGATGPRKPPYFITVYDAPVYALTYSKQCQLGLPANYEMVTVEDFIDLMDQAVHPKAWGTLLTNDYFESSFGNWTDGGAYCDRSSQSGDTYSRLGTKSIHICYTGTPAASFYHTNGINVNTPGYTKIKVTFWYVGNGMETGDSFVLEYYNGTTWKTIKTYVSGTDFVNGITNFRYNVVYIDEGTTAPKQVFPSNMKLRFRCTSNSTSDNIYIDCVRVEAQ